MSLSADFFKAMSEKPTLYSSWRILGLNTYHLDDVPLLGERERPAFYIVLD